MMATSSSRGAPASGEIRRTKFDGAPDQVLPGRQGVSDRWDSHSAIQGEEDEAHGGRDSARSGRGGHGSTFGAYLPVIASYTRWAVAAASSALAA